MRFIFWSRSFTTRVSSCLPSMSPFGYYYHRLLKQTDKNMDRLRSKLRQFLLAGVIRLGNVGFFLKAMNGIHERTRRTE